MNESLQGPEYSAYKGQTDGVNFEALRDSKVDEGTIEDMMKRSDLVGAVHSAGCPWTDKKACVEISKGFSNLGFDGFEIAALAKRLEQGRR